MNLTFVSINVQSKPTPVVWVRSNLVSPSGPGAEITGSDADVGITGSDADAPITGSD